ncbi:Pyruvate, phosphate dikinase regulatory protein 1, chloroplastic, partial [Tetrabaena socialis]
MPGVPRPPMVEGQRATDVSPSEGSKGLESLDDMAAYVERTRLEEESIRRKREETTDAVRTGQSNQRQQSRVELQLLRMRQQEAVRRQQAIKLRIATELANAAVLAAGQAAPAPDAQPSTSGSSPPPGMPSMPGSGMGGAGPPRKKLMVGKKSKRLMAVAAANNLHRFVPPPTANASTALGTAQSFGNASTALGTAQSFGRTGPLGPIGSSSSPSFSASGANGSGSKALLSREDLIGRSKEGGREGGAGPAGDGSDTECALEEVIVPKPIFILSDCTGESAARTVRAALNQFEVRCRTQAPAQIMIFRFVESFERVMDVIREAAKEDALVVYTLVDPKTVKAVQTACQLQNVRYVDLWTTLLDTMEVHLNALRRYDRPPLRGAAAAVVGRGRVADPRERGVDGVPASLAETRQPKASLTPEYFRMIEAVEYTRKMDDGAKINSELNWARQLYNAHAEWPVLDVTLRGIEETAARILKLLNDRRGAASPQWVDAYHAKPDGADEADLLPPATANAPELIYGANESSGYLLQGLY